MNETPDLMWLGIVTVGVLALGGMMFYATMRAYFGAGPKTAVLAGIVAWIAFSLTGPVQFIPLGFFSNALWLKVGAFQLIVSILATIVGAALYKDATKPAVA